MKLGSCTANKIINTKRYDKIKRFHLNACSIPTSTDDLAVQMKNNGYNLVAITEMGLQSGIELGTIYYDVFGILKG